MPATILFPNVNLYVRTQSSPTAGVLTTPREGAATNTNFGVLAKQIFDVRIKAVSADINSGQPEGKFGLPDITEMFTNGIAKPIYVRLIKLLTNGLEDTTFLMALKLGERLAQPSFTNFNTFTNQPTRTWADVELRLEFLPVEPTTLEPKDLSYSADLLFEVVPELPVKWYPVSAGLGATSVTP